MRSLARLPRIALAVVVCSFVIVLGAGRAEAVITFDSAASASEANPLSWPHTVGTELNRLLVVGVSVNSVSPFAPVTSVTYAGQSLPRQVLNNAGSPVIEIWTLVAPPSGTANVVVTYSLPTMLVGGSVSFAGVNQIIPIRASNQARDIQNDALSISTSVASQIGDVVIDAVAALGALPICSPGAGQTSRWALTAGAGLFGGGSTKPGEAGSTSMSWDLTVDFGDVRGALAVISIMPFVPIPTLSTWALVLLAALLVAAAVLRLRRRASST